MKDMMMRDFRRPVVFTALLFSVLALKATIAQAAELYRYEDASFGKGRLSHIDGLPVLELEGTPEEMGRQAAGLTEKAAGELIDYPKALFAARGLAAGWPRLEKMGLELSANFPERYDAEINAFAKQAKLDARKMAVANVIVDVYRIFGCSSLIVEPERSATGGPLFGRNLDFYTLGTIHKYSLITVYRPKGKHALATVGFPGFVGALSGMNDAGLAVAVHEVFSTKDGSLLFDIQGTPYAMCFRRILEECETIEEAEKLLKGMKRTTLLTLSVCDKKHGGVIEISPKNVVLRRSENGICANTNHYRTDTLTGHIPNCGRYAKLRQAERLDDINIEHVADKLHEVNLGKMTLQTMIFEPKTLKLHLAIGKCPSSGEKLRTVELGKLFGKK